MKSMICAVLMMIVAGSLAARSLPAPDQAAQQPRAFTYREIDGRALKAYAFFPPEQGVRKQAPAILLFHGGGWSAGSAEMSFDTARRFASLGLVAISVDYRLSEGKVTPIEALADTCAAFRWARRHAAELDIDPKRVAGYGVSAGGHLVAAAATVGCPSDGTDGVSSAPDLLLLLSPAVDVVPDGWFRELLQGRAEASRYSPADHVGPSTPPACIVMGDKDTTTPLSGVKHFCDQVVKAGGVCELNIYPGLGHLLTRNLSDQVNKFDPDPRAREDAFTRFERFLKERGFLKER